MSLQTQINTAGLPSEVPTVFSPTPIGTLPVTTGQTHLSNAGAVSVGATPSVSTTNVLAGSRLTILQTGAGTTTLSDNGTLPGSMLKLQSATRTLATDQVLVLVFNGTYWCEESYSAAGTGGSGIVPFNANIDNPNVIMLLPGTGSNGSTTITNTGFIADVVTPFGDTQISTAQSKWGGGSIYFDGNGDYLVPANNTAFPPGTGNFTYETWLWMTTYGGGGYADYAGTIFDTRIDGGSTAGLILLTSNAGAVILYSGGEIFRSGNILSTGTWNHIALVRSSGTVTLYLNGISTNTGSLPTNLTSQYFTIGAVIDGRAANTYLKINGYMNDFRFSNIAQYTSNFAPGPAAAFPPAYNPSYLPSSPVAGQLALSSNALYSCTDAVGPVWKRSLLSTP